MTNALRTKHWGLVTLTGLLSTALATAQPLDYQFVVKAEARALASQSFGELGTATMTFTPEADAGFRVQGGGNVVHPLDAAVVYQYGLDMRFQLKGDVLELKSRNNTFNKAGKEILDVVEEILPFVYLAKRLPRSPKGYALDTPHGMHTMGYSGSATEMEVALKRGTTEVARFFVRPSSSGPGRIIRFRINRRTGVNLMFVAQ